MTERMTPSEVATALDAQHKYDKANYPPANPLFAQAAATIRELESRATIAESMIAEANCSLFGSQSFFGDDKMHLSRAIEALKLESGNRWRALKIATEALASTKDRVMTWPIGEQEHCMCGSRVKDHDIGSGHSPVSMGDHAIDGIIKEINEALARIKEVG